MSAVDRRTWLCGAAAAIAGVAGGTFGTGSTARAIEPIARNGKARFKFSLAAYSYRQFLADSRAKRAPTGETKLTLDDFIRDCAAMGLEGTELTSYYFPAEVTPDYLHHVKHLTHRLGLDISGTSTANDFCLPVGKERDEQMAYTKRWIDYAETMGAPVIRVFSGKQRKDQTLDEAHRLAVAGLEEACDYAGQHGVFLALENHGGLTAEAEGMLRLVRDVRSPWFGVNVDTGNFHSDDPYADLAKIAPYALNVQIKVSMVPTSGGRQRADFKRLAQIMRDAQYRGYIVLEFEEPEDPRQACPRLIDELRAAFTA
jgi:sugar phosphate isomerase/epimerase